VDLLPAARDFGLALEQDEKLAAAVAFRRHLLARGEIDLVGDVRDVFEPLFVELREERNALQELHLRVLVEAHMANISPSEALATVTGWASFRRSSARRRVWRACCWCSWACRSPRSSRTAATCRRRSRRNGGAPAPGFAAGSCLGW